MPGRGSGLPYHVSIRCVAIETPYGGSTSPDAKAAASSSRENQRASSISSPSTSISEEVARAVKPSIRLEGNGHGWLATYRTSPTVTPASSCTSRATACSMDSPGSTNPARVEKRPFGQWTCRPSSARSCSSVTSMITAGSVRG